MKALEITSTVMEMADGLFTTENRYPRQVSPSNADFWMVQGRSIRIVRYPGQDYAHWRWECGPVTVAPYALSANPAGFAVDRAVAV